MQQKTHMYKACSAVDGAAAPEGQGIKYNLEEKEKKTHTNNEKREKKTQGPA